MSDWQDQAIPAVLNRRQEFLKRSIDICLAGPALIVASPVIVVAVLLATIDTAQWGIFSQERIGRHGRPFRIHKIRTMKAMLNHETTITAASDPRITSLGRLLRRHKIDELAQLWNVLRGDMSLVGPRPDVPGWADQLCGRDRVILSVRPGITGPASLAFRNEEEILASAQDAAEYNRTIIWPEKVRINWEYLEHWSARSDLKIIWKTLWN